MNAEQKRLNESDAREKHWKRWGPYLSERAWGTVREDYSPDGSAWDYFPHDHARSRAYRWNEDGIAGISDRHQRICFSVALWNGKDPILKERLFGLTGSEGNHGEDVKELYYYLDSTPTHSYMKYLYKYPQAEFPYAKLIEENRNRSKTEREFELLDTGIFDDDRYFDVFVEYAKADVEDILIKITVANRGDEPARINVLPTIWFRNTWRWSGQNADRTMRSVAPGVIEMDFPEYGKRRLYIDGDAELLFTENETNNERFFDAENPTPFVKDGIGEYIVNGRHDAVNRELAGTKAAANFKLIVEPRSEAVVRLRLSDRDLFSKRRKSYAFTRETHAALTQRGFTPEGLTLAAFADFDELFTKRKNEADEFYSVVIPESLSDDEKLVQRQAFAGMLWSKQFYHYVVKDWLNGDGALPSPPEQRKEGRNSDWHHLHNADIISMPDKWE
jgi:hypothetical protein